jgi:hypothetical protein
MSAKKQTIKMVAFNPSTRRAEEVFPESEVEISEMQPRFWYNSDQIWVSVPGTTAAEVYNEWVNQVG